MKGEKYLFDTDTITNIFKPRPSVKLLKRLGGTSKNQQFISSITVGEIVYGAMKSDRPKFHLENLQNVLLPRVNLLPFDSGAAFHYGRLRAEQEAKGKPLSHADLQIAATALTNGLTLVTGNTRHFKMIQGLNVENWM
jgi:tRNA(fMet)-specific endonuclease VapC